MSVCASMLLQLRWIPSCLSLAAAVCNRVPRASVSMHVYYEDQKKTEKKERKSRTLNERTDKRTNERNILNITIRPLTYSICDYEEQTSLCDLSSFLFVCI